MKFCVIIVPKNANFKEIALLLVKYQYGCWANFIFRVLYIIHTVHIITTSMSTNSALSELIYTSQQALKLLTVSAPGCHPQGVL